MSDEVSEPQQPVPAVVVTQAEPIPVIVVAPPKKSLPARLWNFVRRIGLLRLVLFAVILMVAYAIPGALLHFQLPHIAQDIRGAVGLGIAAAGSLLTIALYALLVGVLERRHVIDLRLKRGIPLLIGGTVLAVLLFGIIYAIYFGLHAATWSGYAGTKYVLAFVTLALISGVCEEVIFRGGIYRIMEDMFGSGVALAFSGVLFGVVHLGNPGATMFAAVAIAVEAGILLGAAYAATRSLWFPIGIHIGWNFAEGGIFGAPVSGFPGGHGLLNFPLHGPDWLTGGAFGPEASVIPLVICTLAGIYFVRRTIKKGRWCRIGFRMMLD
jgi:membrane protease YdiL (CAAX protease family)